jgi:AbrB family looped-hinge helix DNA binding protein
MVTTIKLDKAGRLVLPKLVRDELQLGPGDSLELQSLDDSIVLRPSRGSGRMRKQRGVWVFDSGQPLSEETVRQTTQRLRSQRDRKVIGKTQ